MTVLSMDWVGREVHLAGFPHLLRGEQVEKEAGRGALHEDDVGRKQLPQFP